MTIPTPLSKAKTFSQRLSARLSLKLVVVVVLFVILVGYSLYQTRAWAEGPRLTITQPANGALLTNPLVIVTGDTNHIAHLFLNRNRIFTDDHGHFQEKLLLAPGYNIIELKAQDKFGREIEQRLELVYRPTPAN